MGIVMCREGSTSERNELQKVEREDVAVSKYHPVGVAGIQRDQVDSDPEFPTQPGAVITHIYLEDPDCTTVGNPTVCTRTSSLRTGSDASSILSGLSSISKKSGNSSS